MQRDAPDRTDPAEKTIQDDAMDLWRQILSEVTQTPEFRRAGCRLIEKALSSWVGENLLDESDVSRMRQKIEPERERAESASGTNLAELALWGNIGRLITLGATCLAEKDKTDPDRWARRLARPLRDILMNTDLGMIYTMVAASEARVLATQEMIQKVMKEFPTKSGIMPALRLKRANTALKKRNLALKNMEDLAPEILLSSMVNLFNELIEPETLGAFVQAIAEGIRKIHAGSVILGEGEKSMIELTLSNKLRDALAQVDPVLFGKALVAFLEEWEGVASAIMTAAADEPELLTKIVTSYGARKNTKIRRTRKKAELLEELVDTTQGPEPIEQGLADLNTQDVGDTVNAWLRIINRLHEARPDAALTPVASLFSVIDWEELHAAAQWLVPDMVESLKPLAGAFMPSLLHGFCDLLTPPPGEDPQALDEALAHLRSILLPNGGETT